MSHLNGFASTATDESGISGMDGHRINGMRIRIEIRQLQSIHYRTSDVFSSSCDIANQGSRLTGGWCVTPGLDWGEIASVGVMYFTVGGG